MNSLDRKYAQAGEICYRPLGTPIPYSLHQKKVCTYGKAKYSKSRRARGKVGGVLHPPLSWSKLDQASFWNSKRWGLSWYANELISHNSVLFANVRHPEKPVNSWTNKRSFNSVELAYHYSDTRTKEDFLTLFVGMQPFLRTSKWGLAQFWPNQW